MSRLPMSKDQHWKLLNSRSETARFQRIESQVIDNLEELFGFRIEGSVDDINKRSYGVGFDLTGVMNEGSESVERHINVFPKYGDDLSYWVTASRIPSTDGEKTLEVFRNEFSFNHYFRLSRGVMPIVLERFRNRGIFIDEIQSANIATIKKVTTSETYIENISSEMEAWDNLEEI